MKKKYNRFLRWFFHGYYFRLFFPCIVLVNSMGQDHGAWYAGHQERIDQLRKGNFSIAVTGSDSEIVSDAEIRVTLKKHAFPFGTALRFKPEDPDEQWYRETAKKYFWYGVIENHFKWDSYEYAQDQVNTDTINEYLDWAEANDWELRGHALMWSDGIPGWVNTSSCADLKSSLKNRILRDVNAYKGKFFDYDVWNEHLHVDRDWQRCGTDLLDSAYYWAHETDPDARLFVNEYCAVACDDAQNEALYQQVKGMLDRGVPIHGIGAQGHFYADYVNVESIRKKLDRLAELELPIHITEFDIRWQWDGDGHEHTEQSHSDRVSLFLRTVFSHPAVEAIVMWGFWDKRYWLPQTGFIYEDKTTKMTADTVYNLWHREWTTDTVMTTYRGGPVEFRGYYGLYEYSITWNGETYTGELDFSNDAPDQTVHVEKASSISGGGIAGRFGLSYDGRANTITVSGHDRIPSFPVELRFYDVSGRFGFSVDVSEPGRPVKLSVVPEGLYFIKSTNSGYKKSVFLFSRLR